MASLGTGIAGGDIRPAGPAAPDVNDMPGAVADEQESIGTKRQRREQLRVAFLLEHREAARAGKWTGLARIARARGIFIGQVQSDCELSLQLTWHRYLRAERLRRMA